MFSSKKKFRQKVSNFFDRKKMFEKKSKFFGPNFFFDQKFSDFFRRFFFRPIFFRVPISIPNFPKIPKIILRTACDHSKNTIANCLKTFRRKKTTNFFPDYLFRFQIVSRFQKSHLEQRAIILNTRTARINKKFLFFCSIYALTHLRFVNLTTARC